MPLSLTKCVFLDRDGVLNVDRPDYLYNLDDLIIPEGVVEALTLLKKAGFLLIVITNQAGIAKGLYTANEVYSVHNELQKASGNALDDLYFSPYHPVHSGASLSRKPGSLMLEKAISKYNIDPAQSWMIGDRDGDMKAGKKAGVRTIHIVPDSEISEGDYSAVNLLGAAKLILDTKN